VTVDLRERLGGVAYDYLKTPTGERIVVETKDNQAIESGTPVTVTFDANDVMYFDPQSELRLRPS